VVRTQPLRSRKNRGCTGVLESDWRSQTWGNRLDKAILVEPNFATGSDLVEALDRSALPISVALWLYASEYDDWRFVLASRVLDTAEPAKAYGFVHDALALAGIPLERTPPLLILRMSDPFIQTLRRIFSKRKSVDGIRLDGQPIGDRFVEAAIVYRIR